MLRHVGLLLVLLLLTCGTAIGWPRGLEPAALPALPADTIAFVHARVGELLATPAFKSVLGQLKPEAIQKLLGEMENNLGLSLTSLESATFAVVAQDGGGRMPIAPLVLLRTKVALDRAKVVERLLPESKEGAIAGLYVARGGREFNAVRFLSDRSLAFGSQGTLEFLSQDGPANEVKNGPLAKALEQIPQHQVVAAASPNQQVRQMFLQMMEMGGRGPDAAFLGSFRGQIIHLKYAMASLDLAPTIKLQGELLYDEEREAVRGMRGLHAGVILLQAGTYALRAEMARSAGPEGKSLTQLAKLMEAAEKGLDDTQIELKDKTVSLRLELKLPDGVLERALMEAVLRLQGAAGHTQRLNNLRQIVIAMHNYHDAYNKMPGDFCDKDGKPILSWRVAILPYMEQDNLYRQFRTDEPWDSEHNKQFISQMPAFYQVRGAQAPQGETFIQVFKAAPSYNNGRYRPMFSHGKQQMGLGQITAQDGSSNTFAVAESARPVIWTKPDDIMIDASIEDLSKPAPELGAVKNDNTFIAALGDGSVRSFKTSLSDAQQFKKILRQYIGVSDGEVNDSQPLEP